MTDNLRGALLMMASMAGYTFNDACMKALSDELPLAQAIFLRGLGTTFLLLIIAHSTAKLLPDLSRRDWGLMTLRSVAEVAAAYFFITALFNMPLANASAILQALPLTVTLAGALFLGEAVGWRRMIAILVGFLGVLMIIRPGTEGFNVYSVYVVLSVLCVTVRDLSARRLSAGVSSLTVALLASFFVTFSFGVVSIWTEWKMPSGAALTQLVGATLFIFGGYISSVSAMRIGDLGTIAPFRYTGLLWALILGFVVFGDWPGIMTIAGAMTVVATGIFTLSRERRLNRKVSRQGLRLR
ncbi:MAG: DMT family transporter [Paracoccaceae bacterium]|nr:DMT family transporter [Paracoccaceae bacterium]